MIEMGKNRWDWPEKTSGVVDALTTKLKRSKTEKANKDRGDIKKEGKEATSRRGWGVRTKRGSEANKTVSFPNGLNGGQERLKEREVLHFLHLQLQLLC